MNFKRKAEGSPLSKQSSAKMTKQAQYAGSTGGELAASSVAYAMPKFYSPIHTPSNWEIPTKRRDIMQWAFSAQAYIPQDDFTLIKASDYFDSINAKHVIEDRLTEGKIFQYIRAGRVIGGSGEARKPLHMSIRMADEKKFIRLYSSSSPYPCDISEEHRAFVIKGKDADLAAPIDKAETWYRLPHKAKIHKLRADNIKHGDFLVTPLPKNIDIKMTRELREQVIKNFLEGNLAGGKFDSVAVNATVHDTIDILDGILHQLGEPDGSGWIEIITDSFDEQLVQQLHFMCLKARVEPCTRDGKFAVLYRDLVNRFHLAEKLGDGTYADQRESWNFFTEVGGTQYFVQRVCRREEYDYSGPCYDFQINPEKSHLCGMFKISNCRFFAANEPKVAAALNFYSNYPVKDFDNVCEDVNIKKFFDNLKRKLRLRHILKLAAYEYFCIGDVFIFADISCPHCQGSGFVQDVNTGEKHTCNHPGGTFSSLTILNPDWVEVVASYMSQSQEIITLMPDDTIRQIVARQSPKELYDRIPPAMRQAVASGNPIQLHPDCVTHLAHDRVGYEAYGRSLLMRLFKVLAYKDKITQAQWTIADRHIVPMRLVKVGNDNVTATENHIQDIRAQILQTANDPNFVLVTHHAVDIQWIGSQSSILQLSKEYDMIKEEILDGLMINESLLHGDSGSSYASASMGVEAMIERLESFREDLAEFIEERIYRPIAIMQGFMSKDENGNPTEPIYPKVKFKELKLRDESQMKNLVTQLADNKILSNQTLLEYFGFDYDVEVERLRMENIIAAEFGLNQGEEGGPGGGGDFGGFGGFGGGGGGGDFGGGDFGGDDAGGDMGGDMGGMDAGGGGDMGGGGAPEASRHFYQAPRVSLKPRPKRPVEKVELTEQGEKPFIAPANYLMNKPEQKLYNALHKHGIKVIPQFKPIRGRKYLLDFALPNFKLGIECDGTIFHDSPKKRELDDQRDKLLMRHGWYIHRFTEQDINDRMDTVVLPKIFEIIRQRTQKK